MQQDKKRRERRGEVFFSGVILDGDKEISVFLCQRDLEIIKCLARGLTGVEMGKELFISDRTVDCYRAKLFVKMEAKNAAHLMSICFRNKIIE
jgi:two-component system response regulator EvgA